VPNFEELGFKVGPLFSLGGIVVGFRLLSKLVFLRRLKTDAEVLKMDGFNLKKKNQPRNPAPEI
jgi:hypothetical protein